MASSDGAFEEGTRSNDPATAHAAARNATSIGLDGLRPRCEAPREPFSVRTCNSAAYAYAYTMRWRLPVPTSMYLARPRSRSWSACRSPASAGYQGI